MIYKDWTKSTIGEACDNYDSLRKPLSSSERAKIRGKIPYYGAADVIGHIDQFSFDGHYVLIAEDGSVIDSNGNPIVQNVKGRFWVSNHSHVLKGNDRVSTQYIYYFLKQIKIKPYLTGSVQLKLNQSNLNKIPFIYPPKAMQKSITNILSSLDDKIELNNKINKNLEGIAQTLYKRWFVDFEFPNDDGEPYKSSGGEMVESELGLIPKGWEVKELSDVALVSSGKRPPIKVEEKTKEYKYPVIGASGVMAYTQEYNIDEKILIIGRVGTHGIVQRITEKVWASDNTLTIKSNVYEFVYQILNQIDYKSLNRGSTQPLITQTDINKTEILVPKSDLLEYFEKVVSSLFEVHKHNLIQNNKLSKTRDELLPKLMNGEIEVPIEGVN